MSKHTPGPWHEDDGVIRAESSWGPYIAQMPLDDPNDRNFWRVEEESNANARLIAAAPELLEACRAFVTAWEQCLQLEKTDVALALAKTAIAKAEPDGRTRI